MVPLSDVSSSRPQSKRAHLNDPGSHLWSLKLHLVKSAPKYLHVDDLSHFGKKVGLKHIPNFPSTGAGADNLADD